MANKFLLVPQEIYRGLTSVSDTGDLNLDAVRHDLNRARGERTNPSTKNVNYNQQLRRYLKMRRELADRPSKVELTKGISVLLRRGGEDEDGEVVDTPPGPPALPPPPPPPPGRRPPSGPNPPARQPSPPGSPPPRPERPPRPSRASRRGGRLEKWRKSRYDIQQRQPVVRDLLAEAAAAPLPESDDDDEYMLENGFALSAPSQYYGDLPVLPDNAEEIEEMDTVQHSIATRRKLMKDDANDDNDLWRKRYRIYPRSPPRLPSPPRLKTKIELRPPPPRPTAKREKKHPKLELKPQKRESKFKLDPRPSTSRQAGYFPPPTPKTKPKYEPLPTRRPVPYRIPEREPKIVQTPQQQQPTPPAAVVDEMPYVPPPRRGTKRHHAVTDEDESGEVRIRKRVRQPRRVRVQYSPEPGPSTSAQSDEQQRQQQRELFAIPSNQLTKTQRIERLYIKCNHYADRMGVRGNTINTANGNPLAHSNLRMAINPTKETVTEQNHPDGTDNQKGISPEKMELINSTLDKMYNDPSSPAAFAGVTALWKEARKTIKHLRKKDVQHYLDGHRTYTLMRPRRVHFPRAKTVAAGFMTDVQVDLADFQALSRHNRGHRYLLVAVDVLSKRLFVVPLKNKRAEEMLEAFNKLIDQMPMVPHRIFSDKGTEFKNRLMKEFFEEQEIEKHEPVHSSVKASVAERAIRNVKQRLYRYFAEKETLNWVDAVQKIVDGINSSPSRVHDEFVRMSREKGQFEKGYLPNYGDEILEIDEVLKAVRPIRYKLRDEHGEKFKGSFYEQELARVRKDAETSYRIEKVISYPYSWSTIGTLDEQWIDIHFTDRRATGEDRQRVIRVPVPKASHSRVEQLRDFLSVTLRNHSGAKMLPLPRELEEDRNRTKPRNSPPPMKRNKRDQDDNEEIIEESPPHHEEDEEGPIEESPPHHKEDEEEGPIEESPPHYDEEQKDTVTVPVTPKPSSLPPAAAPSPVKPSIITTTPAPPPAKTTPPTPQQPPAKSSTPAPQPPKQPATTTTPQPPKPSTSQPLKPKTTTTTPTPPVIKPATPSPKTETPVPPPPKPPTSTPQPPKTVTPAITKVPSPSVKTTISAPPAQLKSSEPSPKSAAAPVSIAKPSAPPVSLPTNVGSKAQSPPSPPEESPPHYDEEEDKDKLTVKTETPAKPISTSVKPIITSPPAQLKSPATSQVKPQQPSQPKVPPSGSLPRFVETEQQRPPQPPPPTSAAQIDPSRLVHRLDPPKIFFRTPPANQNPLTYVPISIFILYENDLERFKVVFNEEIISHLSFSPQLGYALGFENPQHVVSNEVAKYGFDLRGGISSFAVYSKGLTENMIIGNSLSSLLRVVSISGAIPGEYNEKIYDSPIFARVLPREINEIEIELRTMDKGRLVPFAYGTTMVVLIFKKYDEYVQYGSGLEKDNFDYFRGSSPFQRGYGIQRGAGVGDVFRGLWRFFLPILRRVGTTVGSEALSTGQRVLERVGNEGVPFKEALVTIRLPTHPTTSSFTPAKITLTCQKCYLLTEFRIRKENNNGQLVDLTVDDADIAPIQMIGQTFIRNIKMSINGREIFNANSLMAYKTYFSHELSYSTTAKDSHLNAAGYYRDMGDALEIGNGFIARRNLFAGSNVAQFIAKIDTDLFNQPLYLINFCELDIEILPNDNAFVLIAPSGGRYHFEVVGLKMYVKKVSLMDGLALDIAQKLEVKPVRYAVRKTMMKSMFISPGRYEFTANMFMDQIPRRVTMGLVANTDYVGTLLRSPFNFQPFNVREISITANGRPYPQAPYDLDYSNGKYVRPFNDMNEAVGFANSTESNGITFAQYGRTHCIYVFNLTNSGDDQAALFDLIKNGTTAVSIKFNQPVPAGGIMLVVMGECDSLVIHLQKSDKLIDEHVSAVLPPLIQLCKDKPEESSIFHQAVCWALFALYLMLIISLVLHQLCSIFWLKNGQLTNHKNFERTVGPGECFRAASPVTNCRLPPYYSTPQRSL
ncbi:hypothetical protein niasHS_012012 [Heterodera schachtii]|uniref:Integrase catalytic domain-containing protein n=1 Tax=Heterodera schachtii TaxID=97005 RepID=A0ABD2ID84_HETSC